MGNHPSSTTTFPLQTYLKSNIIHQSNYYEHAKRKLGISTYPIQNDIYQVQNMRLQLNYLQRYVKNKHIKLLHQRLVESPPLTNEECLHYIKQDPTICSSYGSIYIKRNTKTKICMPLHAIFISSIPSPLSVIQIIYEKYPLACKIKMNEMLPFDLFELNHKDHPEYNEIKEFLYSKTYDDDMDDNNRVNNYERLFDLVRTKPISITALKRMLHKNPTMAMYVDLGLTPLHHLCGFGQPTKESCALLLELNPAALIDPVFKKSPLQLLCGVSKSKPTLDVINFLIAAKSIALQFPTPTPFDLFIQYFSNNNNNDDKDDK